MKTKLKNFFLNLQFIFKPWYWIMSPTYSKDMDIHMNELMDKYTFSDYDYYTAYLGNIEIWVSNAPYGCMVPWKGELINTKRPSRLTIQRGLRKLKKDCNIKDSLITTRTKISASILGLFVVLGIMFIVLDIYIIFNLLSYE
jgi:hypothetical protein